jgi:hypothetical protein
VEVQRLIALSHQIALFFPSFHFPPSPYNSPEMSTQGIKQKYYTLALAREVIMRREEKLFIQVVNTGIILKVMWHLSFKDSFLLWP